MDRQKTELQPMPTIWEIPDEVWPVMQTILDEHYPAQPKGHRRVDLRRVLNGINCQSNLAMTAPCIGTSSAGVNWNSSNVCGLFLYKPVTNWAGSTGNGRPPTLRWAKPGWAGTW